MLAEIPSHHFHHVPDLDWDGRTERRGNLTKNELKLGCLELREEVVDGGLVEIKMIFSKE